MAEEFLIISWAENLSYWIHDFTKFFLNMFNGWFVMMIMFTVIFLILIYMRFIKDSITTPVRRR